MITESIRRIASYATLLLSFYALSSGAVRATDDLQKHGHAVRCRFVREVLVVVPVKVNGAGPFDFLLDTGTNSTVVAPDLAARLSLRPADRVVLITVGGSEVVPRARLGRLAVGEREVSDAEVLVADLGELRRLDGRISGVLGQNFLSRFNYLLDYRARRIVFDGDGLMTQSRGARVSFQEEDGRMIVSARPAMKSESALRLVLDSAANGLVIFSATLAGERLGVEPLGGWGHANSFNGRVRVQMTRLKKLLIGDETFLDLPLALIGGDAGGEGHAGHGLLPTSIFRSIYFNNEERYILLNPSQSSDREP
ncbi:MAG: aspartyl protease family protein [Pyrinomonadaceae bacterium]